MNRWLQYGLVVAMTLLFIAPSQALAYSYGDANTEDVAETFKLVEASLGAASPNWKAAEEAYKVRRSEIESHFGVTVASTLDHNLQEKDVKLTIANFKAVLVMNLDRRFKYAIKDVSDYAATKLLLAKAKATFSTLEPYMSSDSGEINQAFEDALEALGNPGLFGVGKKEVDPDLFKKKVNFIYAKVKPAFPYKAYIKPAEPVVVKEADKEEPPVNEADGDTKEPVKKPESSKEPVESDSPVASESPEPAPIESASATESASAEPSVEPVESVAAAAAEASPSETAAPAVASQEQKTEEASGEHAPMERSDKTNSWVTFAAIGGVILIGGGAVWFARKKGLI